MKERGMKVTDTSHHQVVDTTNSTTRNNPFKSTLT